mmetsp:Transcript_9374/g.35102  ORF Transcript_9374/g.35102 Transcript_9374/m.35102 type:complete len:195 (-) Transcript_9374:143-727(-)
MFGPLHVPNFQQDPVLDSKLEKGARKRIDLRRNTDVAILSHDVAFNGIHAFLESCNPLTSLLKSFVNLQLQFCECHSRQVLFLALKRYVPEQAFFVKHEVSELLLQQRAHGVASRTGGNVTNELLSQLFAEHVDHAGLEGVHLASNRLKLGNELGFLEICVTGLFLLIDNKRCGNRDIANRGCFTMISSRRIHG